LKNQRRPKDFLKVEHYQKRGKRDPSQGTKGGLNLLFTKLRVLNSLERD